MRRQMRKLKVIATIMAALTLILEILPWGAVLNFAVSPEEGGGRIRESFSYFDLTPFGYANFGPFIAALLTCVIFIIFFALLLGKFGLKLINLNLILLAFALFASITPLFFGIEYYSIIGLFISLLLAAELCLCLIIKKKQVS